MTNLRVWHIANIPNSPFVFSVNSIDEAKNVLNAIALFDLEIGDGEEKPIANLRKRINLIKHIPKHFEHSKVVSKSLDEYEEYLSSQNNGVTLCHSNVQGLELMNEDEWEEWYNEEDESISDVMKNEPFPPEKYVFGKFD